ncbi:MAG: hypothetical protein PHF29_00945 [Candidatus Riflebacteria bacterium]|nr:hypothetical protein [Candidatus Riflebacteria bacterium]
MKNSMVGVLVSVLVSVMISFFLWNLIVVSAENTSKRLEAEVLTLETENMKAQISYETLKKEQKAILDNPQKMWSLTRHLLKPGFEEAALMKMITDCTYDCSDRFIVRTFEVYKPYFIEEKTAEEDNVPEVVDLKNVQLDEFGMPIGAEIDDGTWKGAEVVPVKMTFITSFKSFAEFFRNMKNSNLPLHVIRSLDMNFVDSDKVRGTLIISFPLAEAVVQ